jgi:hypothetical protein
MILGARGGAEVLNGQNFFLSKFSSICYEKDGDFSNYYLMKCNKKKVSLVGQTHFLVTPKSQIVLGANSQSNLCIKMRVCNNNKCVLLQSYDISNSSARQ